MINSQTVYCNRCGATNRAADSRCCSCGMSLYQVNEPMNISAPRPAYVEAVFRCPFCGSTAGSQIVEKVSTGGIVMIVALLLICFPLFWIGFFMKEAVYYCRTCHMKLG